MNYNHRFKLIITYKTAEYMHIINERTYFVGELLYTLINLHTFKLYNCINV